jgi:hypothetical protein
MKEQSAETSVESRPVWEGLEAFARRGVQDLLQRVLEEEVVAMLGRRRYARHEGVAEVALIVPSMCSRGPDRADWTPRRGGPRATRACD